VVVLAVFELVGGGGGGVVEGGDAGREEGAVITISDGQHAEHAEQDGPGVQDDPVAVIRVMVDVVEGIREEHGGTSAAVGDEGL
jgi:hypothetical protein